MLILIDYIVVRGGSYSNIHEVMVQAAVTGQFDTLKKALKVFYILLIKLSIMFVNQTFTLESMYGSVEQCGTMDHWTVSLSPTATNIFVSVARGQDTLVSITSLYIVRQLTYNSNTN